MLQAGPLIGGIIRIVFVFHGPKIALAGRSRSLFQKFTGGVLHSLDFLDRDIFQISVKCLCNRISQITV